ncbi:MAG: copper resistance protein NlpE N-terminal domain-containing protein [bacterium]|nr:copper resistance protein NlpE N-terminal domain-containing protein [bacterium]
MKEKKLLIVAVLVFAGVLLVRFVPKLDLSSWLNKSEAVASKTAVPKVEEELPPELVGVELFSSSTATLLLNNDGKFYLNQNYDEKAGKVDVQSGSWSVDSQTNLITLNFDAGEQKILVRLENGDVQMLDENGQPMENSVFGKISDIKNRVIMAAPTE